MLTRNDVSNLNGDLTGQVLVLRPEMLGKRWQLAKFQLVLALGGFGCHEESLGSKIYCEFLKDGEKCSYRRNDFLGIATKEQINAAMVEEGDALPLDPNDLCFLAIGQGYWGRGETLKEAKKACHGKAMIVFHCHVETQVTEIGFLSWPDGAPEPVEVWKKHTT